MAKAVAQGLAQHKPLFFFETDRACDVVDCLESIHRSLNIVPTGDEKPALKKDFAAMTHNGVLLGGHDSFAASYGCLSYA